MSRFLSLWDIPVTLVDTVPVQLMVLAFQWPFDLSYSNELSHLHNKYVLDMDNTEISVNTPSTCWFVACFSNIDEKEYDDDSAYISLALTHAFDSFHRN